MKVEFLIFLQLCILIFSPASIRCEQDSSEDKFECEDTSNHCSSLLKTNSGLCNGDYQEYFAKRCKKSCGLCALAKLENKLKVETEMIVELQTQREELNTKLEFIIKTMASNDKRHDVLIEEKNGLTSKVGDLTRKNSDLTNKVGDLTRKNSDLTRKNSDLTNKVGDLKNKVGDLTRKNSDLTNKVGDLTNKVGDLTNKVTDLIEKVTLNTKKDIGITKEITALKEKHNNHIAFRAYKVAFSGFTGTVKSWSFKFNSCFQKGGAFNPSSGVFTAPSDGLYAFNLFIEIMGSNDVPVDINLNGKLVGWARAENDDTWETSSQSTILELKKQDKVSLGIKTWRDWNNQVQFFFSGYRITKT